MGFMKFQSKNQMKLNFVQVGGKKRFIHFFESLFVKRFKTSYLNSGQGENTTKKWQKRNKSKKLMTIFFLFKKNKERIGQKSRTWTGEKLFTKNNIIFFEYFFFFFWFYLTYHHNFLCFIIILSGLVFLRFVKDLSYKKEKNSWIKKYITA